MDLHTVSIHYAERGEDKISSFWNESSVGGGVRCAIRGALGGWDPGEPARETLGTEIGNIFLVAVLGEGVSGGGGGYVFLFFYF